MYNAGSSAYLNSLRAAEQHKDADEPLSESKMQSRNTAEAVCVHWSK